LYQQNETAPPGKQLDVHSETRCIQKDITSNFISSNMPNNQPGLTLFTPLPDPVGFAGNFAANLGGQLVTGGGSQFPDKPLWLDGIKVYSDRIFALAEPSGDWSELTTRLPIPMAHFAFAASKDVVYLAGGMAAGGLLAAVFELRPADDTLSIKRLPDLPERLAYGAAGIADGRLFIAGGQHDASVKVATRECWSLNISNSAAETTWRREPDLPGTGTFVAAMASDDQNLFLIGGVGFDSTGKGVQSDKVFQLQPGAKNWEPLANLPEPRVGAVTPCPILDGNRIFVMGGYATAFAGERRDHPGFSAQTFVCEIGTGTWSEGPLLPHEKPENKDATSDRGPAPMVAAPGVVWRDHFLAVGGEVRASVRTCAVVGYPLKSL